jgi:tetratricopeptide (TPR) repeat protein
MSMCRRLLPLLLLTFANGSWADIWSDSYELEYAAQYKSAAELFDPLLKQEPGNEFARLRRAWLHYLAGSYNSSQSDYKKALQANPESLDATIGMTLPLLAQQRWKEATLYARQALHVAPWNYYAHLRLLVAEEGQQQWKTLLEHAQNLHRRYPSDATVLVYQARAQLWLGDRKAARNSYQQVLQRIPGHVEAQNYLESLQPH